MNPEQQNSQSTPQQQPQPEQPHPEQAPVVGPQAQPQPSMPPQPQAAPEPAAAVQYQAAPAAVAPAEAPAVSRTDPTTIILQWLTYAFWGWTILALSVLTTTVIYSIIDGNDTDNFTAYGIAAVLVLLPISYICDYFYTKRESEKKSGAELIVMVIHAVLFAIFGIGALIWAVISLVTLFTSTEESTGPIVSLVSALIITCFYGLTFLRTVNFQKLAWFAPKYKMIMLITVGIIAVLGIFGPVAKERSTRDDRLIETHISSIENDISDYARTNNKLPESLNDLTLDKNSKQLVERKLVTYKPEGRSSTADRNSSPYESSRIYGRTVTVYKYQLCANYKYASDDDYGSRSYGEDPEGYSTFISSYSHPAGEVCYKLKTTEY